MSASTNHLTVTIALALAAAAAALSTSHHPTSFATLARAEVVDAASGTLGRAAPPGCFPALDPVWLQEPPRVPVDPAPPCTAVTR